MNVALQICDSLRQVESSLKAAVRPIQVVFYNGKWTVMVQSYRDLEQIPGQASFKEFDNGFHAAIASKELQGVRFECYLIQAEYERVREKKTA